MNSKEKNCRSKKPISNCRSKKNNDKNRTLAALVSEYLQDKEDDYKIEDRWWRDKNITWSEAIERAWRSLKENGKMHDHQRRVGKQKLDEGLKVCLSYSRQPDSLIGLTQESSLEKDF